MRWKLHEVQIYGREIQPNDHLNGAIVLRTEQDTFNQVRLQFTDGTSGGVMGDLHYTIERPVISV